MGLFFVFVFSQGNVSPDIDVVSGIPFMDVSLGELDYSTSPSGKTTVGLKSHYVEYCIPIYLKYDNVLMRHTTLCIEKIELRDNPYSDRVDVGYANKLIYNKLPLIDMAKGKMRHWTDNYTDHK